MSTEKIFLLGKALDKWGFYVWRIERQEHFFAMVSDRRADIC